MSAARPPKMVCVRSSLSRQMASADGGRTVGEAERMANTALAAQRDQALRTLAATVQRLDALCAAGAPGTEPQVYALGTALLDIAGFIDTGPFYEAAYSLCDISDRMTERGAWSWPAVAVHARALTLILAEGCRVSEASAQLLAGLRAVSAHVAES